MRRTNETRQAKAGKQIKSCLTKLWAQQWNTEIAGNRRLFFVVCSVLPKAATKFAENRFWTIRKVNNMREYNCRIPWKILFEKLDDFVLTSVRHVVRYCHIIASNRREKTEGALVSIQIDIDICTKTSTANTHTHASTSTNAANDGLRACECASWEHK